MPNAEQIEYWNGDAGQNWAREDGRMAALLNPVAEALLDHLQPEQGIRALDIGCGGGSQSLLLAQRIGASGKVVGIDISEPMLAIAQQRAAADNSDIAALKFLRADAQVHNFENGSFDLLYSRFGVMFFDDPEAAFSNLRPALNSTGKLGFCCWPEPKENAFFQVPLKAVLEHVPPPEPPPAGAPGPFAFADPERVKRILTDAGFQKVDVSPFETTLKFGRETDLKTASLELAKLGAAGRLLADQDDRTRARALASIERALAPYFKDGALHFPTKIWFVTAAAQA
jgi:ubiquinone/menaquinone biosynthesis C-methylase UbiE